MRILGAILAGGQARRFGSDKALALLDGRPLIEHVRVALEAEAGAGAGAGAGAVLVCGRHHPGLASLADRPEPGLGPLGGLAAALDYARAHGYDAVLTAPCDMPRLPGRMVQLLAPGPAFLADQPTVGLWPAGLASRLDAHLRHAGDRSLRRWTELAAARAVLSDRFPNINTIADLAALDGD